MLEIQRVTIIGANGTMGRNVAAIFASFGNAKIYLVSRTAEKSEEARNKAYQSVRAECIKEKMIPADFTQLSECVLKSDLVFEACKEEWNIKTDVHIQIANILKNMDPLLAKKKFICSGTSGLSITKLAELYPPQFRSSIIGMHFFNPPYNMTLCEIIPTKYSVRKQIDSVKDYVENQLLRTVVEVADSPAFLGNRVGFQFINEALQMAERYKYNGGIDYIDAILGPFTGRAMPPLVTANFVGLDVHKAIVDNLYANTNDYAHDTFVLPSFVVQLIEEGKLGRKSGEGLYKTVLHDSGMKLHQVYDIEHGIYRQNIKYNFPFAQEMIATLRVGDYNSAFRALIENRSLEAEICCSFLLKYILYSLISAKEIGYSLYSADDVMATGFNWCPPLALLEAFENVRGYKELCEERLDSEIVKQIDFRSLLGSIEKSKYDYRRFMHAK